MALLLQMMLSETLKAKEAECSIILKFMEETKKNVLNAKEKLKE